MQRWYGKPPAERLETRLYWSESRFEAMDVVHYPYQEKVLRVRCGILWEKARYVF